jgi:sulfoxide reductase catalytic subunit YedY
MKGAGVVAMAAVLAACGVPGLNGGSESASDGASGGASGPTPAPGLTDELGAPANTWDQITHYNNFYEFTTDKTKVAGLAEGYPSEPWKVEVGGLVENPRTFDIDDLRKFEEEERIYRLRCVEAWSMVIPWLGFPLSRLLKEVKPLSKAKYVRFQTIYDPDGLPGQRNPV